MDGWNGWMDKWKPYSALMDETIFLMNEWINGWDDGRNNIPRKGGNGVWMDRWMDGRMMDETIFLMNKWMEGWSFSSIIIEWMDG